ncbi:hypothetical protein [Roseimaritima ulvae]|uniref:Uncharacterized protein n=1 Tax=Roseimaritima ulvae TaxID=980254 RepID=A0A5B9QVI7_9BACT|nr:hypothetical protein [Roseimaritima ulvae]QEG41106.1 hypothetical protein UC8_31240 [Roseimaritima ulvae]
MKLLSVRCNHCGAPLEIPKSARYVTCGFCDAQLAVHRSGNAYSTELLEEIKQTTDGLVRDVAQLKKSTEIEQLDREWELRQSELHIHGKNGRVSVPSKTGALFGSGFAVAFGVFWMIMAGGITFAGVGMGAPAVIGIFPLFGLVFILVAIFGGISQYQKADEYERARTRYQQHRRKLLQANAEQE